MYKLWNWLFGWDYIEYAIPCRVDTWNQFTAYGRARVIYASDNRLFFKAVIDGDEVTREIHKSTEVIWLTCEPPMHIFTAKKDTADGIILLYRENEKLKQDIEELTVVNRDLVLENRCLKLQIEEK